MRPHQGYVEKIRPFPPQPEILGPPLLATVNPTNRQVGIDGTVGFLLTQYGHGCP